MGSPANVARMRIGRKQAKTAGAWRVATGPRPFAAVPSSPVSSTQSLVSAGSASAERNSHSDLSAA
jgi:hypothetical protein